MSPHRYVTIFLIILVCYHQDVSTKTKILQI